MIDCDQTLSESDKALIDSDKTQVIFNIVQMGRVIDLSELI